jgi:hypothetical protein
MKPALLVGLAVVAGIAVVSSMPAIRDQPIVRTLLGPSEQWVSRAKANDAQVKVVLRRRLEDLLQHPRYKQKLLASLIKENVGLRANVEHALLLHADELGEASDNDFAEFIYTVLSSYAVPKIAGAPPSELRKLYKIYLSWLGGCQRRIRGLRYVSAQRFLSNSALEAERYRELYLEAALAFPGAKLLGDDDEVLTLLERLNYTPIEIKSILKYKGGSLFSFNCEEVEFLASNLATSDRDFPVRFFSFILPRPELNEQRYNFSARPVD